MCSKQAKIPQTDYTIGGRDISNTAIPYYKKGVTQLGDYMENVQNRMDPYLEKYVDAANAADQSDFLRNYQRAMGQQTAQNYAATGGGYSSANQLAYDDLQRYYNHYASELYAQGLNQANQMAAQEYNMLTGALGSYGNAYKLGEEYSKNEQYNKLVDEANKNWWSNLLTSAGDSIGSISMQSGNPMVMAIGGAIGGTMGTAGRMTGSNAGELASSLRGIGSGNSAGSGLNSQQYQNTMANMDTGIASGLNQFDWFKNNPFGSSSGTTTTGGTGSAEGLFGKLQRQGKIGNISW